MKKPNSGPAQGRYALAQDDLWLWIPVLFSFGAAFYFSFATKFSYNFAIFAVLFLLSSLFYFIERYSYRGLLYATCAIFLCGSFYAAFYQKTFFSKNEISGKLYVDIVGKVEAIRKFTNSQNHLEGANLVILEPKLYKSQFVKKVKEKKKPKKKKSTKKKSTKKRTYKKKKEKKAEEEALSNAGLTKKEIAILKREEKKIAKEAKKIEKNFVNLSNYQELDREFLDYQKNYQQVSWRLKNGRETYPTPLQKISLNLAKYSGQVGVNDVVAMRAMLEPIEPKEFEDDFDFSLDAKAKKINAHGFVIGEIHVLKKAEISNIDAWFLGLREIIRAKIEKVLSGDEAAIAMALLIGDQTQISKEMMQKIRNSGLAHLLSISGFHLSLAAAILFVSSRFLLSRNEYLALNFDLKKVAAFLSIFAVYFYLKIAASPVPAQRSFFMILLALGALFAGEKTNALRIIMTTILLLILYNPYLVFNVSFQLSFAAILVLGSFYEKIQRREMSKFLWYFFEMILLSIFIEIATLPFLMYSFQNVSLLGFVSNILAIPLTSFFIMPAGFAALFAMLVGLEKYFLLAANYGILLLERIMSFVTDLPYAFFVSPRLSGFGLALAIFGLFFFCLLKTRLRYLGILFFAASFLLICSYKKPSIIFQREQKFFVIYDNNGLRFSERMRPSKRRDSWMKRFNEKEFKTFFCEKKFCEVVVNNKKILVVLQRNKISEICRKNFDVMVNLTGKYQLPSCSKFAKIKIDNFDFYKKAALVIE